ncbi:Septum site-determining protein MinD [bioreactor metagenome]|uniref:Septum site-determining protein MinD n=1 Tax=bioreactor metagenome TaxID=1076179 RepID=A0A645I5H4_9ZZZZ
MVTPNYLSVRDAEALSFALEKNGISDLKLVVNMVDPVIMKKEQAYNIDDIIDTIKVPFLGVVPFDRKIQQDMYTNTPFYDDFYVRANEAFRNISQRLLGNKVKIMKLK